MSELINRGSQDEYSRILDAANARQRKLSQTECTEMLMEHGLSYNQTKDGANVYLHHGLDLAIEKRGDQDDYDRILNQFRGPNKTWRQCIDHLKSLGYSYGQAKNAVHQYRIMRGLIRKV